MSWFEYLGESINPGPSGGADFGGDDETPPDARWVVPRLLLSIALLAGTLLAIHHWVPSPPWKHIAGGLFTYLCLSWLIRPTPDMSNVGWLGGLIDDPFRISDDWNRFLFGLKLLLLPGLIVMDGFWNAFRAATGFGIRRGSPPTNPAQPRQRRSQQDGVRHQAPRPPRRVGELNPPEITEGPLARGRRRPLD
ncbi:MAG: hypothetical protein AB7N76_06015 [Planctomycetota bacterium]